MNSTNADMTALVLAAWTGDDRATVLLLDEIARIVGTLGRKRRFQHADIDDVIGVLGWKAMKPRNIPELRSVTGWIKKVASREFAIRKA